MTNYTRPGTAGSLMSYESRYGNHIGGEWVPPVEGLYFDNPTPVTGQTFCEVPRSDEADIEKALDAGSRRGVARENHKMMQDHYQQTKNLLVSYSDKALGFF
jgi:acyl-CoA reductase-like NAD-dependent aldehyde dehydrogenase